MTQPLWSFGRIFFDAINVTDERREDSYAKRGTSFMVGIALRFGTERK